MPITDGTDCSRDKSDPAWDFYTADLVSTSALDAATGSTDIFDNPFVVAGARVGCEQLSSANGVVAKRNKAMGLGLGLGLGGRE